MNACAIAAILRWAQAFLQNLQDGARGGHAGITAEVRLPHLRALRRLGSGVLDLRAYGKPFFDYLGHLTVLEDAHGREAMGYLNRYCQKVVEESSPSRVVHRRIGLVAAALGAVIAGETIAGEEVSGLMVGGVGATTALADWLEHRKLPGWRKDVIVADRPETRLSQ